MRIPADQLLEIIATIGAGTHEPGDARRAPRVMLEGSVRFTVCTEDFPHTDANGMAAPTLHATTPQAIVRNLSARGICLVHTEAVEAGRQFVLHLFKGAEAVNILCTVLYCDREAMSCFRIGAEFTCNVTELEPVQTGNLERIRHSILD